MPTDKSSADLAVMSIETYEQLAGRIELYGLLQEGMQDIRDGDTRDFSSVMSDLRAGRKVLSVS